MSWQVRCGDVLSELPKLEAKSVQTVVTSPPYWGLRDYGNEGQLGLEPTPGEYVAKLVEVFRKVERVLRNDGTVWLNLGDSYASDAAKGGSGTPNGRNNRGEGYVRAGLGGLKPKDLVGIPWRVALALQTDGWYLRSDIIWAKPNPMPESVTDRPTRSHEYIFLLTKRARYYYDADAVREELGEWSKRALESAWTRGVTNTPPGQAPQGLAPERARGNKRSVWNIATFPFPGAHFAVFPTKLVEPCVLAGSAEGDAVLDPFCGSGTVGVVALRHNRSFIGIDLSPDYCQMARHRICDDAPLLNTHLEEVAA